MSAILVLIPQEHPSPPHPSPTVDSSHHNPSSEEAGGAPSRRHHDGPSQAMGLLSLAALPSSLRRRRSESPVATPAAHCVGAQLEGGRRHMAGAAATTCGHYLHAPHLRLEALLAACNRRVGCSRSSGPVQEVRVQVAPPEVIPQSRRHPYVVARKRHDLDTDVQRAVVFHVIGDRRRTPVGGAARGGPCRVVPALRRA